MNWKAWDFCLQTPNQKAPTLLFDAGGTKPYANGFGEMVKIWSTMFRESKQLSNCLY